MATGHRTLQLVLAAAAVCASLVPGATATEAGARQSYKERMARGDRLLAAGKWEEALSAYGPWGARMGGELRKRIRQAQGRNDTQERLQLYQLYFRYFPFGHLEVQSNPNPWNSTAFAYAELLEKHGVAPGDEAAAQTIAAAPKYSELMKAIEKRHRLRAAALTAEIVKEHPKSIFCPGAVLRLAGFKRRDAAAAAVCESHLPLLEKHGATERAQLQVLWALAAAHPHYTGEPDGHRKAVAAYLAIAQRTDISYEKCVCLFNAARSALSIREPDGLAQSRRLYREFLAKYPAAFQAAEARRGLVQTYLVERNTGAALEAVRGLQNELAKDTDLSQPFFDISRAYFAEEKYERSLTILRENVERYPGGAATPMAWIGLGETYGKLGREAEMVEAYRTAAGEPSIETRTSIMDASSTRNRAHEWLGAYYTRKENWKEALKWWRAWKPRSSCGTCAASMRGRRTHGIVHCLLKLGRKDEAIKTIEASIFAPRLGSSRRLAVMLVDLYREKGQLDVLAKKVKRAIKNRPGARIARDYIALLRMADRGDVKGLWAHLEGDPFHHVRGTGLPAQASRLLAGIPDKAIPYAVQKMASPDDSMWASVVLARMKAPDTLRLVRTWVAGEEGYSRLRTYLFALAVLGTDDAYDLLKSYAEHGTGGHRAAAAEILKLYPKPGDAAKKLSR